MLATTVPGRRRGGGRSHEQSFVLRTVHCGRLGPIVALTRLLERELDRVGPVYNTARSLVGSSRSIASTFVTPR